MSRDKGKVTKTQRTAIKAKAKTPDKIQAMKEELANRRKGGATMTIEDLDAKLDLALEAIAELVREVRTKR